MEPWCFLCIGADVNESLGRHTPILWLLSPSSSWQATGPKSPDGILTSAEPGGVSFSGVNNGAAEAGLVLAETLAGIRICVGRMWA